MHIPSERLSDRLAIDSADIGCVCVRPGAAVVLFLRNGTFERQSFVRGSSFRPSGGVSVDGADEPGSGP